MEGLQQFELDCPQANQLWPVYVGPGPGQPIVGYFKHGDCVNAKAAAGGWLQLPRGQGWVKARDPERVQFLKTQHGRFQRFDDMNAAQDGDADVEHDDDDDCALFGWHEVLAAPGLHTVALSQLPARQLFWCDACGESLHQNRSGYAMTLGCGHAFHPACVSGWHSSSICYACHLKCTPARPPLDAPPNPTPAPAATLHFSSLPPRTHHRLLLTLLVLTALALLHANHALLTAAAARTLVPLFRLTARTFTATLRALCRLLAQPLRLLTNIGSLVSWLLTTILHLPATACSALYHAPGTVWRARQLPRALLNRCRRLFQHLATRAAALYPAAGSWSLEQHLLRRASAAMAAFWDGYGQWLRGVLQRQMNMVRWWVPWDLVPLELLAAGDWLREVVAGQWGLGAVKVLAATEWWEGRNPAVAAALGKCHEWTAEWGPGTMMACSVAVLAVVGLCVAGRKVRL